MKPIRKVKDKDARPDFSMFEDGGKEVKKAGLKKMGQRRKVLVKSH